MTKRIYNLNGREVYYDEYGAGAWIKYYESDAIFADFTSHLDAEEFLEGFPFRLEFEQQATLKYPFADFNADDEPNLVTPNGITRLASDADVDYLNKVFSKAESCKYQLVSHFQDGVARGLPHYLDDLDLAGAVAAELSKNSFVFGTMLVCEGEKVIDRYCNGKKI